MASQMPRPGATDDNNKGKESFFTTHTVYPSCITLGVLSICLGVGLVVTMAMLLRAQRDLPCDGLTIIGGVFLPVGFVVFTIGIVALRCCSLRPGLAPEQSCCAIVGKVFAGIGIAIVYILLILICTLGTAFYIMSVNLPETTIDRTKVPGLTADVVISRDGNGIVHVEASTIVDGMFGHGFATAQDRLGQLEVTRLAATGTLSKYAGKSTLKLDKSIRSAGFHKAGAQACAAMSAESVALWQRYVDGVNYYLQVDPNRPPEFMFLSQLLVYHEPAPFTLNDICSIVRLAQWQLSRNVDVEILRWQLFADQNKPYDEIDDLWPSNDGPADTIFSDAEMGYNASDDARTTAREANNRAYEKQMYDNVMGMFRNNQPATNGGVGNSRRQSDSNHQDAATSDEEAGGPTMLDLVRGFGARPSALRGAGSNAWAVRSPNGKVIVASDPHLDATAPSVWYPISIVVNQANGSKWVAAGVSMPGLPGILIGRVNDVAWGITLSQTDLGDLYVMQPDTSSSGTRYMYKGVSQAYTTRTEVIEVYQSSSVTITVYESVYGPDIAPYWDLSTKHRLCLNYRGIQADNTTINGFARLMTPGVITTVADLRNVLFSQVRSPGLSISIGDRAGSVGYAITGAHPVRALGHTGRFPILGNGSFDYVADVPFSALPAKVDSNVSSAGAVSCANQRVPAYGYPYSLGFDWSPAFRGRKLKAAIAAASPGNFSNVAWTLALQTEVQSVMWTQFLNPLLQTNTTFGSAFISLLDANGNAMLQDLRSWDGNAKLGAMQPSRMWKFLTEIAKLPGQPALDRIGFYAFDPHVYGLHVLIGPSAATTAACAAATNGGTCASYAASVWNRVAATPRKAWGIDANQLTIRSLIAHGTPIQCMFDRQGQKNGDQTTLNVADMYNANNDASQPTQQVPSMRFVMDWSDDTSYYFALPGGASGNPFSQYYLNLLGKYSADEYVKVKIFTYDVVAQQRLSP